MFALPIGYLTLPVNLFYIAIYANMASVTDVNAELFITMDILRSIFQGTITKWNHPLITELNPSEWRLWLSITPVECLFQTSNDDEGKLLVTVAKRQQQQ